MRTFLRILAAAQTGTGLVLAVCSVVLAGYEISSRGWSWATLFVTIAAAAFFWFVAVAGGVLWCMTVLTLPPPPRPVRSRVAGGLRVLAGVQLGIGVLVIVAAGLYASDALLLRPWKPGELAGAAVWLVHAAFGLSCLGGMLWCAVRVAYPEEPAAR